mmetsp:Transcript_23162/g.41001  ORF Transcript_23162/g.41001 Transcript_23162/m.41001 type:complete len:85 (+) Transcript_23162:95-349(+)
MSDSMTDKVREEAELRRQQAKEERAKKKENVSERMKKMAEVQGTAPGFNVAALGAQIAKATAAEDRNEHGGFNVKDVAKKIDES